MTCNIPIREFKFIYAVLKFVYNISSNASNRSCCLAIIKLYSYKINQVFVNCLNYLARNFRIKGYEGHFSKGLMDGPGLMYYEKSGVLLFRGTFRSAFTSGFISGGHISQCYFCCGLASVKCQLMPGTLNYTNIGFLIQLNV